VQPEHKKTRGEKANKQTLVTALLKWFCSHARDLPWRHTGDPYAIWVSEIMLQQTQVKTVIPYWERWMRELPSIQSLADAPSEKIHKLWEGLGYYTRVRNMQKAAQLILQVWNGKFPTRHENVLALPGIGRYTAGAVCSIAFNQPSPIVDGNVIRVLARVFGISGNPKDKKTNVAFWEIAETLVRAAAEAKCDQHPAGRRGDSIRPIDSNIPRCSFLNQSIMELGALICTPRDPKCSLCPLKENCVALRDNQIALLPDIIKRTEPTRRTFVALIVEKDGKFLIRQRPAGVVNAHLWEFPNFELSNGIKMTQAIAPFELGDESTPICEFHHSITRYRNHLKAFRARLAKSYSEEPGIWRTTKDLQTMAFSSAHKRVLQHLLKS
jgi:A/G-specific adenine glycosylase